MPLATGRTRGARRIPWKTDRKTGWKTGWQAGVSRRSPKALRTAIALLAVCVAGCGRWHPGAEDQRVVLYFVNESQDQVDVYAAVPGGESQRIGTVMAGRTERLTVPASIVDRGGGVTIAARIFARGRVVQTGPTSMMSGDVYTVRLASNELALSVFSGEP